MPRIKIYQEDHIASPMWRMWQTFSANPFAVIGLWAVIFLLILTLQIIYPTDIARNRLLKILN